MGCTGSKQARRHRRRRSLPPHDKSSPLLYGGAIDSRRMGGYASNLSFSVSRPQQDDYNCGVSSDEEEMMKGINDLQLVQQRRSRKKNEKAIDDAKARPGAEERGVPATSSLIPRDIEPEIINAWDLMEGLEDASPLHYLAPAAADHHASSSSFSSSVDYAPSSPELLEEDLIISDFNAYIMSSIGIALEDLPPAHPLSCGRSPVPMEAATSGIVQARIDGFQQKINAKMGNSMDMDTATADGGWVAPRCKFPPGGKKKVVLYFTSLRGVRKTYEDCRTVQAILKGYGVRVEERDVSMDGGFREELDDLLGPGCNGGNSLPAVFVDGHYLGGIEEVRQFHEAGELRKALEGCETLKQPEKGEGAPCEGCGNVRFLVCPTCSGSCKLYMEEEEEEEEEEEDDDEEEEEEEVVDGFRRCSDCNENGLVRCPFCC